jgi:hypothetical protein
MEVDVCVKGTAKTLDQRDCASPCRGFGVTGFAGQMCGNSAVDDAQLLAFWQDPEFDSNIPAFYYARVIEIPTPRWTAFDELRFGIKMDPEVTRVLQERAYTSPIWYTP